jgi:hypothetical protein
MAEARVKLVLYATGMNDVGLRAAPATRTWMDETNEAFAYRCLPLNIANAHGWEFLNPVAFSARWNGGEEPGAIDIRSAADHHHRPITLFGHGILTFHIPGVFKSEPGWNMMVGGSPNRPKDGIYALSGIIETDWAPYSFTMNWRFTRPGHWVTFDEGEPFCFVFPVQRNAITAIEPEIRTMASNPGFQAEYEAWSKERREFSNRLTVKDSDEARMRWQKRYYRGLDMHDKAGIADHQAKLRLPDFKDLRERNAKAATRTAPLPVFFRKATALSRVKHDNLGLHQGTYSFAATTPLIPLAAVEFAIAAQNYPIAFSGSNPPRALCVTGTMPGINLQVDAAGKWRDGAYIPAAVRRFPFVMLSARDKPDLLTLGIEEECALLDPAAPDKLIANGEMTPLCKEKLAFAAKLGREFEKTEALCDDPDFQALLKSAQTITPLRLTVRSSIRGLRVVDPEKLAALPEEVREKWRASGWLEALEAQIASNRNWARLLAQEDATGTEMAPA